ncbi:hypothetical protein AVEN_36926-1 [Araneus ventricosus]|uniref:Uncharacterized protein n=1 Tax=Araneus ventricosus TaxID=182803 RepID=A0A4Y2G8B7_ARAVE|nr:hypothetical protein AVEN_36926-1 [Araneus ventricosus]
MHRARNCLPLLGSMVGKAVGARILILYCMGSFVKQTDSNTSLTLKSNELPKRLPKFLVLHNEEGKLKNVSFPNSKTYIYLCWKCAVDKKVKSGDLLVESSSLKQSEQLLSITKSGDIPVTVSAHASLNYTRGVMLSDEFLMVSDAEFVSELEAQSNCSTPHYFGKRWTNNPNSTCHINVRHASSPDKNYCRLYLL